jgi:hypothetical protein
MISCNQKCLLFIIDETLNANSYINILDENQLKFDDEKVIIFMQYLASCRRAVFKASNFLRLIMK